MDNDTDLLKEIVDLFIEDCPRLMSRLQNAIACGDANEVERAAHSLKGSVGSFAARPAYNTALKLEQIGKSGELSEAPDVYAALERQIAELKHALLEMTVDKAA